ncbi:MAG: HU family DNA-binding protein [Erysipelotrichaceae bacterium]|nr:HU family DNA-binding protein [Erysipelotrichaceae bacterium]
MDMTIAGKKDLAKTISEKLNISQKQAVDMITALTDEITSVLAAGDTADLGSFGKFEVKERAARKGINPRTKEQIEIPASKSVKFSAKKALKDAVNGEADKADSAADTDDDSAAE